jgi:hypothetical protein
MISVTLEGGMAHAPPVRTPLGDNVLRGPNRSTLTHPPRVVPKVVGRSPLRLLPMDPNSRRSLQGASLCLADCEVECERELGSVTPPDLPMLAVTNTGKTLVFLRSNRLSMRGTCGKAFPATAEVSGLRSRRLDGSWCIVLDCPDSAPRSPC